VAGPLLWSLHEVAAISLCGEQSRADPERGEGGLTRRARWATESTPGPGPQPLFRFFSGSEKTTIRGFRFITAESWSHLAQ